MHTVRRQAHRVASGRTGDGALNYNPFARQRGRETPTDIENDMYRTRSEAHVTPELEAQRRQEGKAAEAEFPRPDHHNTEPTSRTPFGSAPSTIPESSAEKETASDRNGVGKDSTEGSTVVSASNGPTKRARFKAIFRKEHGEDEEGVELERVESEQLSLEERKKKALKRKIPVGAQIRFVLFGAWINVLLIMVPVGFAVYYARLEPVPVFIINFVAIIPLAAMLSTATEELAIRVGETLGGLLNATFGNAVELIVSVQALIKNEITIVKTSLIGSMLSNLLLVLGMSFFLGGINRLEQFFNVTVAQTAASLLALCIASLIIPTVFHNMIAEDAIVDGDALKNQELSRGTAVILLAVYACYLGFQLKTHAAMYNAPSQKVPKRKSTKKEEGDAARGIAAIGAGTAAASGGGVNMHSLLHTPSAYANADDDEDEFETPQLSVVGALITLALSTTLVAFCSEFMVSSIDGLTATGGVSTTFVGLILLPIVGNAAEHATAVTVAIKDKMDLSIGVAVGSSMQIALLVFPVIVILGWMLGKDCMTLYFDTFQIATLFVSVLLVNYLIQDGKSHWLEGILLMASYIIIALAAWFYPNIEEGQC
ncbi:similar to vacuolar calcium ion transporter /H(+) exchanger [Plenodomus lingam JN3]|uniref:Similar to vacuolar calcium ion transporter /H(+) exchanger n=1 Tax=Leptosphaeria maculans (strain JN3 / isolate v23.1.3 / race Av1-4-5-6-7-8) TaxID=985895 RepID=E4ZRH3_LEPMJ|nr:similar to vacuolar calcium ion transporter /H(+) exchanger [Plenodomus lingam JN3]CBX93820.1 similar to vacuolar calcium ion transporter /H(+) exchanger [Plenodomus lingam JN3]